MLLMVCVEVMIFHGRKKKEFATINIGKGGSRSISFGQFSKRSNRKFLIALQVVFLFCA